MALVAGRARSSAGGVPADEANELVQPPERPASWAECSGHRRRRRRRARHARARAAGGDDGADDGERRRARHRARRRLRSLGRGRRRPLAGAGFGRSLRAVDCKGAAWSETAVAACVPAAARGRTLAAARAGERGAGDRADARWWWRRDARARWPLFALLFASFLASRPRAPLAGIARTVAATRARARHHRHARRRALRRRGVAAVDGGAPRPPPRHRRARRRARARARRGARRRHAHARSGRAHRARSPRRRRRRRWPRSSASSSSASSSPTACRAAPRSGSRSRSPFATPLLWYARVPDGTALATLLLLVAGRAARAVVSSDVVGRGDRRAALALGLSLGAVVVVEPTLLLAALVLVAWCGLHRYDRLGAGAARCA